MCFRERIVCGNQIQRINAHDQFHRAYLDSFLLGAFVCALVRNANLETITDSLQKPRNHCILSLMVAERTVIHDVIGVERNCFGFEVVGVRGLHRRDDAIDEFTVLQIHRSRVIHRLFQFFKLLDDFLVEIELFCRLNNVESFAIFLVLVEAAVFLLQSIQVAEDGSWPAIHGFGKHRHRHRVTKFAFDFVDFFVSCCHITPPF